MGVTRKRGGRAPLNPAGSTPVPTRFGNDDLSRIDAAWPKLGFADRSAFIRRATIDKADAVLNIVTESQVEARRAEAVSRKHETRVLTSVEAELFAAAAELIGRRTPYAWGGGTITGPSMGMAWDGAESKDNPQMPGFDAGSLAQYLLFRAFEIMIPRTTTEQFRAGQCVQEPMAGDLVFFSDERPAGALPDYAAVYLGRGCIAEATKPGQFIRISALPATGVHLRRLTPINQELRP